MKQQIAKHLILACALAAAGGVGASMLDAISPSIGVDYRHIWNKGRGDWGKLFPKSFPGGSVYLGLRWLENFGVEMGYDFTGKQFSSYSLAAGETIFNRTVQAGGAPIAGRVDIRRTGAHLDLVGYWPVASCIELIGTVGAGWIYHKINVSTSSNAGATIANQNLASVLQSVTGKSGAVARLRFGLNYNLTEILTARVLLGFETGAGLRIKTNNVVDIPKNAFAHGTMLSVGMSAKF